MTTLRIQLIDPSAPGSRKALKAHKALLNRITEARISYYDCLEAYTAAREAAGYPREGEIDEQLENPALDPAAREALEAERQALIEGRSEAILDGMITLRNQKDTARIAWERLRDEQEDMFVQYMSTDDGTPVEEVLDQISEADFQSLIQQSVEAVEVTLPTNGGSN